MPSAHICFPVRQYIFFRFPADHVTSSLDFSKALNRLGESALSRGEEEECGELSEDGNEVVGAAFQRFAVVAKEVRRADLNFISSKAVHDFFFFFLPVT